MKKLLFLFLAVAGGFTFTRAQKPAENPVKAFTSDFDTRNCTFDSHGRNHFFILEPGYRLILKGKEGKDSSVLTITVLDQVKEIANTQTRVVEERETTNGKLTEVSKNYFAFCKETGTVFYFGEDVDNYKNGVVVNHHGSWTAEGDFFPGVAMPGLVLLGARYYQELANGVALDRAEVVSLTESLKTPMGTFPGCLKTEETSALDPAEKEYKIYAPGIGLIKDEGKVLVSYGFNK